MIDLEAPAPLRTCCVTLQRHPIDDADAIAWWICSLVAYVHREPTIDALAVKLARVAPIASA